MANQQDLVAGGEVEPVQVLNLFVCAVGGDRSVHHHLNCEVLVSLLLRRKIARAVDKLRDLRRTSVSPLAVVMATGVASIVVRHCTIAVGAKEFSR